MIWHMLNKNYPATACLFDITGVMIVMGVTLAFLRGLIREPDRMSGLPRQDRPALALIASIVVAGFILEGMRISMTGRPDGAGYAFIGYIISIFLTKSSVWTLVYGYLWYVHAILTGLFIAYLPFSRLLHIIMAPLILAINAVREHEHRD